MSIATPEAPASRERSDRGRGSGDEAILDREARYSQEAVEDEMKKDREDVEAQREGFYSTPGQGSGKGSGGRPLFDDDQLRRLYLLQQQAPWLYGGQLQSQIPMVQRPVELDKEIERLQQEEAMRKRKIVLEIHEENQKKQLEERIRFEKMMEENQKLRMQIKDLEERTKEERYMTPPSTQGEPLKPPEVQSGKGRIEQETEECKKNLSFAEESQERKDENKGQERPEGREGGKKAEESDTVKVMLKLMEGMHQLQKQLIDGRDEDRGGGGEFIRSSVQLPMLAEWSPSSGPIDLNDWLSLIEPMMSDLTGSSGEWWKTLMEEATSRYHHHMRLPPLDRISHDPEASTYLKQPRWVRLERRASTVLLAALHEGQREDLISAKKLSALKIICQLLVTYQPGGLAEKELILRQLESPGEASSLGEAVQFLRKWSRWRRRAGELGVSEPDPFLLLRGLNKIIRRPLEGNRELNFKISLARSTLQVDATPTSTSVTSFATHLLAEFEQVAHQEVGAKKKGDIDKMKAIRAKKFEEETLKGYGGKGKDREGDRSGDRTEKGTFKCRYYLSEGGCKKGKECQWSHDQKDERRRCWNCGGSDHMALTCTRPKKPQEASPPKSKVMKPEDQENAAEEEEGQKAESMKELLEEANKMLRSLSSSGNLQSGPPSVVGSKKEDEERSEVVERLQQQLNALKQKTLRLSRLSSKENQGLIDSGATHALRPERTGETTKDYKDVQVSLANGTVVRLKMSKGGVMISTNHQIEPIVPMGSLVKELNCKLEWGSDGLCVVHPVRGRLAVDSSNGCPQVSRKLALELIGELEEKQSEEMLKSMKIDEEMMWLQGLVESHPVLRVLPQHVKERLVVEPGGWGDLPCNRRMRKRMKKEGMVAYIYSGGEEGFTLSKALEQLGQDSKLLLEVDIKRGPEHDIMMKDSGPYSGLLRAALDGKVRSWIGSPNCRTRSVLRHYPIEGVKTCARPVRAWNGEEYGKKDLTMEEMNDVREDDILLWRLLFLAMVSRYVAEARKLGWTPRFTMEHPSSPRHYMPETVSWWDTEDWKKLKEEFSWDETHLFQGEMGGDAMKPTTFGGDLKLRLEEHSYYKKEKRVIKNSRDLARWSPGVMTMVASALLEEIGKEVKIQALSWQGHLELNHVPYRKDCLICQESQQKCLPHRRVKFPTSGVLSMDTSGPLVKAPDLGGYKARYLLVGALTWAIPKDIKKFQDGEGPEEQHEEGLPEIEEAGRDMIPGGDLEEGGADILGEEEVAAFGEEEERAQEEEEVREEQKEDGEKNEDEELKDEHGTPFEIRVFRIALPMTSKNSVEVTKTAIEMLLRLRADGYNVNRIHTDRGKEFMGTFKKWARARGIITTRTAGDDARANGRVEVAVQSVKAQIRRTLRSAGDGSEWWPWAARYVNEVNRCFRLGTTPSWPGFLGEVLTRKRAWKKEGLETTMDRVKYLAPSWEDHGHWVVKDGEAPRVTRYFLKKATEPVQEGVWLALEREGLDALKIRRRIRGKTTMMSAAVQDEEEEDRRMKAEEKRRILKIVAEEMTMMVQEDPETAGMSVRTLSRLRRMIKEPQEEEEEVLQTKVVTQQQVSSEWKEWVPAVQDEMTSLLQEKEALREVKKEELEKMYRKAYQEGRKVELIPSRLVCTVKPGERGGKKKIRWVACGNYEERRDQEENYSGGADATAFRVMVAMAQGFGWEGSVVDVKTAFLNAKMVQEDDEPLILIKPPYILIEKKMLEKSSLFEP